MSTTTSHNDKFAQPKLAPTALYKKQRRQKTIAVLVACSGFLIMSLGLPFIEGVSFFDWIMVFTSTITIWAIMLLILLFKLDKFLTFDPHFLLVPAAASAILISVLIHILPDLRLLLLSGWYAVLLFGAGQLSLRNVLVLNVIMIIGHISNISLLIYLGEDLTFTNELGLFMPYIVMWSYLSVVLDQVKKRRDDNKNMRKMLSHLLIKKDQLLTDVSHELATPLTILKLQVEALKDNIEEDVFATYDALDVKLSDLEQLIKDIQLFSQSDSGALKLDLSNLPARATLQDWQPEMLQSVAVSSLDFNFSNNLPDSLMVTFDQNKLKQVLLNIVANSVKYTYSPGAINFEANIVNNKINFIIEDSAPSIHDKHLNKIFDRLYRVDSSRNSETGGSGLGLAICKSLVQAHNGTIWAEQSGLGGLKITIELPFDSSNESAKHTAPAHKIT